MFPGIGVPPGPATEPHVVEKGGGRARGPLDPNLTHSELELQVELELQLEVTVTAVQKFPSQVWQVTVQLEVEGA